jgi:hypothetical protein
MSKEQIFVRKETVELDFIFGGTDLAGMLEATKKVYAKYREAEKKEKLQVVFTSEWAGYDGGSEIVASFYRTETDKEYQARIDEFNAQEEKKRLKKEARKAKALEKVLADEAAEFALYEKLQKKFQGKSDMDPGRDYLDGPMIKMFRED